MDELTFFARPKWRSSVPALWIGPDRVRIGDDVILDRMTPQHVDWIASLDGMRGTREILRTLPIPEEDAGRIVRALINAGALRDASRLPAALRWLSPMAREEAEARYEAAIDCYRDDVRALEVTEGRHRARIFVSANAAVRELLHAVVLASGMATTNSTRQCDVAILADAPHPDIPRVFDEPAHVLPHVHVGILGSRAAIGPFVIPGRTSCLRCTHIHRTDGDSTWPLLAVQWTHRKPTRPDPLLAHLASVHAVALVRSFVDGEVDDIVDRAWQITLPAGAVTEAKRPRHPLCGCGWLAA